jgi:hypothetical protein
MTTTERADRIARLMNSRLVNVAAIVDELQADRAEVRAGCAAIADNYAEGISRGSDRLTEFERGGISAARHLGRTIREGSTR